MERSVNLFETVAIRSVDGDVKLCYRTESGELCRMLSVADEKGGYFAGVEEVQEFINLKKNFNVSFCP